MKSYLSSKQHFAPKALSILITSLLVSPISALAEQEKQSEAHSHSEMDTIIVTARQSKENFSEVPITINVMDEDHLKKRGLFNIKDAIGSVTGVDINDNGSASQSGVRIRGVGSLYLANRDDTSVSLAIDGIPTATENLFLSTLDTAQIEVLKGPQGTVYGRSSEAGAINITTNRPTDDFETKFKAQFGEDAQYLAEGIVSGPLAGGFKGRLAVQTSGSDHWVENINTGNPITDLENLAVRGHLAWEGENTSMLVTAEHHKAEGGVGIQVLRPYDDQPIVSVDPGRFKDNEKTVDRLALNIEHELDFALITSITARTKYDIIDQVSMDKILNETLFGYPVESVQNRTVDDTAFSQDVRLSSLPNAPFFWIVGASYWQSEHGYYAINLGSPSSSETDVDTNNLGLYGELTYPFTELLSITAGARLARDEKDFLGTYQFGEAMMSDPNKIDDDYATGRIALSYKYTSDTHIYLVGSHGYKPGGFNEYSTQPADSTPYKAAEVASYEVGFKSIDNDYKISFNGAVFFNDVKNDHVLGFNATDFSSNVLNANTQSAGMEVDARWLPFDALTLSGAISYIDSEITTDVNGVFGGDVKAGNDTPDTPNWSANLGIDWIHYLSNNLLGTNTAVEASFTYRYQGERAADPQNNFNLNAYSKVDLQLGLSNSHGRVYLWADNLLDKQYDLYGFSFGFPGSETGAPARGRNIGIGIEFGFY